MTVTRIVNLCAAVLASVAVCAGAQAPRTAFDGQWAAVTAARPPVASRGDGGFRVGDMGSGWGSPLTIRVEPARVLVAFNPYLAYDLQPPVELVYPLGAAAAHNAEDLGYAATRFSSRSAWRGDTLTTTDEFPVPPEVARAGMMAKVHRTLTVVRADTLVIETTRDGVGGAPTVTTRTTYVRRR